MNETTKTTIIRLANIAIKHRKANPEAVAVIAAKAARIAEGFIFDDGILAFEDVVVRDQVRPAKDHGRVYNVSVEGIGYSIDITDEGQSLDVLKGQAAWKAAEMICDGGENA